jgi:hypothetical protein
MPKCLGSPFSYPVGGELSCVFLMDKGVCCRKEHTNTAVSSCASISLRLLCDPPISQGRSLFFSDDDEGCLVRGSERGGHSGGTQARREGGKEGGRAGSEN